MLGGPDASVIVHERVELVTRQVGDRSELAAFAETAESIDEALVALHRLEISFDVRAAALAGFRRALIATRDRWPALEREFPEHAFVELLVDHPRAHRMLGHTSDPVSGGLNPAYAAVRRGRHALFSWWSAAGGFYVPVLPAPPESATASTSRPSPCDWLDVGGCDLPCELLAIADCDLGCL